MSQLTTSSVLATLFQGVGQAVGSLFEQAGISISGQVQGVFPQVRVGNSVGQLPAASEAQAAVAELESVSAPLAPAQAGFQPNITVDVNGKQRPARLVEVESKTGRTIYRADFGDGSKQLPIFYAKGSLWRTRAKTDIDASQYAWTDKHLAFLGALDAKKLTSLPDAALKMGLAKWNALLPIMRTCQQAGFVESPEGKKGVKITRSGLAFLQGRKASTAAAASKPEAQPAPANGAVPVAVGESAESYEAP